MYFYLFNFSWNSDQKIIILTTPIDLDQPEYII